jgi:hypothetical protein
MGRCLKNVGCWLSCFLALQASGALPCPCPAISSLHHRSRRSSTFSMRYIRLFSHKGYPTGTSLLLKHRLSLVYYHHFIVKFPEAATSQLEMSVKRTDLSQATRPTPPEDFVGVTECRI